MSRYKKEYSDDSFATDLLNSATFFVSIFTEKPLFKTNVTCVITDTETGKTIVYPIV